MTGEPPETVAAFAAQVGEALQLDLGPVVDRSTRLDDLGLDSMHRLELFALVEELRGDGAPPSGGRWATVGEAFDAARRR